MDLNEAEDILSAPQGKSTLSESLSDYHKAIREEFTLATKGTSDEIADEARSKLALLLPDASNELLRILRGGTKEDTVRLGAVKLIFEYTLGKPGTKKTEESDYNKILKELMLKPEAEVNQVKKEV